MIFWLIPLSFLTPAIFKANWFLAHSVKVSRKLSVMNDCKVKILGVCGGIGSGKSQACKTLVEDLGCWAHIEADKLAHQVYNPDNQAFSEIVKVFGSKILAQDGLVDRKKLGDIVFSSPASMKKLESIVWPYVKNEIEKIKKMHEEDLKLPNDKSPILVLEAAVLIDAGWEDLLDGLWAIDVPREITIERLETKRGLSRDEAVKRIDAQKSRRGVGNLEEEVKNGVVSGVISNDNSLNNLKEKLSNALENKNFWY